MPIELFECGVPLFFMASDNYFSTVRSFVAINSPFFNKKGYISMKCTPLKHVQDNVLWDNGQVLQYSLN